MDSIMYNVILEILESHLHDCDVRISNILAIMSTRDNAINDMYWVDLLDNAQCSRSYCDAAITAFRRCEEVLIDLWGML